MKLQNLILRDVAKEDILFELYETEEKIQVRRMATELLYGRMKDVCFMERGGEGIYFRKNGVISFDTFQNSFSTGKWKKYTVIDNLHMVLDLKGSFKIAVMHKWLEKNKVKKERILLKEIDASERQKVKIEIGELRSKGILYAELKSMENESILYAGYYGTEDIEPTQNVKIALDICTFKREQYVARNISILKRDILENEESPCYQKMWVHISDNASSLDGIVDTQPNITVDKNPNLGGVGGFTRGIIETKKRNKEENAGFTHVLIMDDDATISSAAIEVNFLLLSYLKSKYFGHTIGGKLLVLDAPFLQYEVGAQWNSGDIVALKNGRDIRNIEEVLYSEEDDEKVEYQGWWYCCIPLSEIQDDNLPLPIFIHRDDVEYGIRTGRERFIFMNQICIWHEAFAGKLPGALDYYDIRNHCITNAIQCPDYTKEEFKKFFRKWVWGNIAKYRYKYIDYNIRAVEDFCKGIDWLLNTDGENLHKELLSMNYKAVPIEDFVGQNGFTEKDAKKRERGYYNPIAPVRWFHKFTANGYFFPSKTKKYTITAPYGSIHKLYRKEEILVVDNFGKAVLLKRDRNQFWECKKKLDRAMKLIDEKYDAAAKSYHDRYNELVSLDFWNKYLGLNG